MPRDNWDDLRFILAVADEGSLNGAARRLGVNHATVLRRVAAFERAAGTEIFDKTARGYAVPAEKCRVIDAAREVDEAVQSVIRMLAGVRAPLSGDVRVTTTDSFGLHLLPEIVAEIALTAPDLRVEIVTSNLPLDLRRSHADITVRPAQALSADLVGETVARLGFGAYHAADRAPGPRWIGLSGRLTASVAGRWQAEAVAADRIVGMADSFLALREMAAAGLGATALPHLIGAADARLVHAPGLMPPVAVDVWVAAHADLAAIPRIARLRAMLAKGVAARAGRLRGPV